jgi:hypothetical protein
MQSQTVKRKVGSKIPWGWAVSEDNDKILVAIPDEQEALEKAKNYLKTCSLYEVADWMSRATGRPISHAGLKYILERNESG